MARIRTIKPEFWTDTLMVQLDPLTRLLFIGLWTAADDHGAFPDEPERLAMEIMPREPVEEVEYRLDLLIAVGRISRMLNEDGTSYLVIAKWADHQRVDKPSKSRITREGSRKYSIPLESRRKVAIKYGCTPGDSIDATCYFCGQPGSIHWPTLSSGKPSSWVAFSNLELDHFHPESKGGDSTESNLVLSCRGCNRSRRDRSVFDFISTRIGTVSPSNSIAQRDFDRNTRESSRILMEGKEGERKGNGKEEEVGKITETTTRKPVILKPAPMHPDWIPSDQFDSIAKSAGLVFGKDSPVEEMKEFRAYWLTQPNMHRTESEWDYAFIKHLKAIAARGSGRAPPGRQSRSQVAANSLYDNDQQGQTGGVHAKQIK